MKLLLILLVVGTAFAESPEENGGEPGLFEGDIILTPTQRFAIDMGLDMDGGLTRGSSSSSYRHWTNGVVPYTYDPAISSEKRAMTAITDAMNEWSSRTCIKFKKRTTEKDYVHFFKGKGCSSYVGKIGGMQTINLASGCWKMGTVAHEMAHALGFYHEQSRPDRDSYVQINYENIRAGYEVNFEKHTTSTINSLGTPYDYGSVMHYGTNYFSKNGKPTIEVKKLGVTIGQRVGPSITDVKQMNLLYKCKNIAPCVDKYSSCASYKKYCSSGYSFIIKNCRKTCNLC